MIHYKCRLDKIFLDELLKEQVEDIALCMSVLELDVVLLCERLCLVGILDLSKVNARILLDSVDHCESFKRLAEVDLILAVRNAGLSADLHCDVSEHILGKLHHAVIVGISLIKLHKCELGVMPCINALVSENSAYLIDSFKSADDKSFKVKLEADTQLNVLVESVIVGLKRSCCCAACIGNEHRSFDLHKALRIEVSSDRGDDLRTLDEGILDLGVADEVGISLSVTNVCICQTVPLFRQRQQGL